MENDFEELQVVFPCLRCFRSFSLDNARHSKKWYPNSVMCAECHSEEAKEIESEKNKEVIMEEFDYEEMDMPTPCQHCGELFDLNDGHGSGKWYPSTIICPQCSVQEDAEIEEDERWETINDEISNALYDLENEENLKSRLGEDNILKILKIAQKLN